MNNYVLGMIVGVLIIFYGAFFEGHKYWKSMKIKKRFYNHPAFVTGLIILITIIIGIIFGK